MSKKDKPVKVSTGHYKYKGYDIRFYGYHHPDKCVWWEAVNEETGCAPLSTSPANAAYALEREMPSRFAAS